MFAAFVPPGVVTRTLAVPVAPGGIVAVMVVALTTLTPVARTPPIVTSVAPVKWEPVIVTRLPPPAPLSAGEMAVTMGTPAVPNFISDSTRPELLL